METPGKRIKNVLASPYVVWPFFLTLLYCLQICTPVSADDWSYACTSWTRIFRDAGVEYMAHNSRLTGTVLTRVFSLSPVWVVDVGNTVGYVLIFCLLLMITFGPSWKEYAGRWKSHLLMWALCMWLMPKGQDVFLWHCGAAFYLWPLVFTLMLLYWGRGYLVDERTHPTPWYGVLLLVPVAVMSGLGNYNFGGVAGLVLGIAWLKLLKEGSREHWKLLLICLVLAVAIAVLLVAPGNFHRAAQATAAETQATAEMRALQTPESRLSRLLPTLSVCIPFMLVSLAVFWNNVWHRRLTRADVTIMAAGVALGVISAFPVMVLPFKAPARAYSVSVLLCYLPALRLLLPSRNLAGPWLRGAFMVSLLVPLAATLLSLPDRVQEYWWWQKVETVVAQQKSEHRDYVVFPYRPTKDACMIADTEKGGHRPSVRALMRAKEVYESRVRCRYSGAAEGCTLQAELQDVHRGWINDIIPLKDLGGFLRVAVEGAAPAKVVVAYPSDECCNWYSVGAFCRRALAVAETQATQAELERRGYTFAEAEPRDGAYVLTLEPFPRAWKRPLCPDVWIQIPGGKEAGGCFIRMRCRPDWR